MENSDLKILVVDDSKVMRRIIGSFLNKMGCCDVAEASSANQALGLMEDRAVDLVLSDVSMPGLSGLDFLKIVRQDPDKCNVTFVMITAEAQLSQIVSAFRERVDGYITKPFTQDFLEYIIKKTAQRRLVP